MKYTFDDPASLSPTARPSISARLARFLTLLASLFTISAAVIVTRRLSQDSLALLLGLTCGIAAMLPSLLLLFLSWRRELSRHHVAPPQSSTPSPPVIVVSPPTLPYSTQGNHSAYGYHGTQNWSLPQQERTFEIIGDDS